MKMASNLPADYIQKIIIESLLSTKDGVGLFDEKYSLVFCNHTMASLFGLSQSDALYKTFAELSEHSFNSTKGINIESPSLDAWLKQVSQKRRVSQFRSFETDTKDGKWYLVTEQLLHKNHLYIYITDITDKKNNENKLSVLTEKLSKLASTDFLTNIDNRRSFYDKAESEFNRSIRGKSPLSVLIIDLDNFKRFNDDYGHACGDMVLQIFAKQVQTRLRQYDVFGRIGGEEFALLMPNTAEKSALIIAERIRECIEQTQIPFNNKLLHFTISIGVAEISPLNSSIEDVIQRADKNLYRAKYNGKNQVYFSN
jgi:diguanylate cyclase (GGDEF)-like protein